jgi:hypothetical protein
MRSIRRCLFNVRARMRARIVIAVAGAGPGNASTFNKARAHARAHTHACARSLARLRARRHTHTHVPPVGPCENPYEYAHTFHTKHTALYIPYNPHPFRIEYTYISYKTHSVMPHLSVHAPDEGVAHVAAARRHRLCVCVCVCVCARARVCKGVYLREIGRLEACARVRACLCVWEYRRVCACCGCGHLHLCTHAHRVRMSTRSRRVHLCAAWHRDTCTPCACAAANARLVAYPNTRRAYRPFPCQCSQDGQTDS